MTKTLDLGCGDKPRNPFGADEQYGVDVRDDLSGFIKKADLAIEPIPFASDYFDYVSAYDFIEHIPRVVYAPNRRNSFVELMNEIYRILKPGGLFLSQTPAFPHGVSFRDPTHINIITDETFPIYFDDQHRDASIYGFTGAFKIIRHEWRGPWIFAVMQKVAAPGQSLISTPASGSISVVMPVYNGAQYLAETLDSLLAQRFTDFEVVCVDDASTDNSPAILDGYAMRDSRIKVIKSTYNLGAAPKAIKLGIQHAKGDYFVYCSQDDLFSEDWLEKMHTRAIETGADAVIPEVVLFHQSDTSKNKSLKGVEGDDGLVLSGPEACRLSLNWKIAGNALWNFNLVKKIGYEDYGSNADEYSARRFFLQSNKVAFSQGKFLYRQDNPGAITKRFGPHAFDWPLTQLRLANLWLDFGLEAAVSETVVRVAQREIKQLKGKLAGIKQGGGWSVQDVYYAEMALSKFDNTINRNGMYEIEIRKPGFRNKLRRSIKKRTSILFQ